MRFMVQTVFIQTLRQIYTASVYTYLAVSFCAEVLLSSLAARLEQIMRTPSVRIIPIQQVITILLRTHGENIPTTFTENITDKFPCSGNVINQINVSFNISTCFKPLQSSRQKGFLIVETTTRNHFATQSPYHINNNLIEICKSVKQKK